MTMFNILFVLILNTSSISNGIENSSWYRDINGVIEVKIYSEDRQTKNLSKYNYSSSFNGKIISNLYSNLNSLNIFQLIQLEKNYEAIGYSATEVKLHLNKIYSIPFYLTLTTIIGALLMFKLNFIKLYKRIN